jgi:Tfp pilus assembly protein PilZ
MPEERRSAKRSRLAGLRATYEGADGTNGHADVFNISRAGLFLETADLVAVGKRLSLEVRVTGEPGPWPALGRVIWARAAHDGDDRPCGMGVKLIDVEDAVVEAIDRLVELREPTEPGIGDHGASPHPFDQTILGVGTAVAPVASKAPPPARASVPAGPAPVARHSMPTEPAPPIEAGPASKDEAIEPLITPLVPAAMTADTSAQSAEPGLAIPLVHRSDDPEPIEPLRRDAAPAVQTPIPQAPAPAATIAEAPRLTPAEARAPVALQVKNAPAPEATAKRAVEASSDEPDPFAPPATKRGGRTWIAVLVALVALAAAAYVAHGLLQAG